MDVRPHYALYSYFRSSASWRVRNALEFKGLPWEYRAVHLIRDGGEQLKPEHLALNPMAEVPVLVVTPYGGQPFSLTQSVAILEHLEEVHPEPALLPSHPTSRALVRAIVETVNSGIHPIQNLKVLVELEANHGLTADGRVAWARRWIERGFAGLETMLERTAGRFAVGDAVTLADCVLVPQVYNAERFGADMTRFPTIARVAAAASALPAFARATPSAQPDAPPAL